MDHQKNLQDLTLAFIGAGNIATAISSGLIAKGLAPSRIIVADPMDNQLADFQARGMRTTDDNRAAVREADIVVLSVKPNILPLVARDIAAQAGETRPIIISVAAGVTLKSLSSWLGKELAIVRCMPNTPALVHLGASGLFAADNVSTQQQALAEEVLSAVGIALWMDNESQLDSVTAVSGSGPAYFFYIMEIMTEAATGLGLSPEAARQLVLQTALGAATMAMQSDDEPAELRRKVTSPGGTTAAALESMQDSNLAEVIETAIRAAHSRSVELSREADQTDSTDEKA